MHVTYTGRRPSRSQGSITYQCFHRGDTNETRCQVVAGKRIDEAVVEVFLAATQSAGVEAALLASAQLEEDDVERERLWRLEVEQAEYEAQRAQR